VNTYNIWSNKWRKNGDDILIATPSKESFVFYDYKLDEWLETTIQTIKKHSDRKIIIRDKKDKGDRIGNDNIYNQFMSGNFFTLVTASSIAATEAIGYGIPVFSTEPHVSSALCSNDLSMIETPYYPIRNKVKRFFEWMAYCQYTKDEIIDGTAYSMVEELYARQQNVKSG
jgi:hypothetical protein